MKYLVRHMAADFSKRGKASRQTVKDIYRDIFAMIKWSLKNEQRPVKVHGFGTFKLKDSGKKFARNVKTGEMIPMPPHKKVSFKASRMFNKQVLGRKR